MTEMIDAFVARIRQAGETRQPLCVRGSGSKDFYGGKLDGEPLDVGGHAGILDYEPSELVLTARAGTPLKEVEAALAEAGQMLPFEPPHFGAAATLGGCIASGLAGPRRPYAGAVRDFVLGIRMLDGRGEDLRFGGQVMKNVAGYDISRLMAGSMGTLGILLEVSLKVLPRPAAEWSLSFRMSEAEALHKMNEWSGRALPVSATCYREGYLSVRLSGTERAVEAARSELGGDPIPKAEDLWRGIREQTNIFPSGVPIWRVSVPSTTPPLELDGQRLVEWGGALRWIAATVDPDTVRRAAAAAGGHATLFRSQYKECSVFHPLPAPLLGIHRRLKHTFDPHGILNPGRLYTGLEQAQP